MTTYCTCGFKNEYSGVKPRFCSSCGQPFDKAFVKPVVVSLPPGAQASYQPRYQPAYRPQYVPQDQYQAISVADLMPDPSAVRIEGEPNRKVTIGDVQKNKDGDYSRPFRGTTQEDREVAKTQDDLIQSMVAEAAAAKPVVIAPVESAPRRASRPRKSK